MTDNNYIKPNMPSTQDMVLKQACRFYQGLIHKMFNSDLDDTTFSVL